MLINNWKSPVTGFFYETHPMTSSHRMSELQMSAQFAFYYNPISNPILITGLLYRLYCDSLKFQRIIKVIADLP